MICCTRNLLSFLVAVLVLTGCMSLAAGTAGIQPTEETVARAATAGSAPATEARMTSTRVASATATLAASPTHTALPTTTVPTTVMPNATATSTRPAPISTPTLAATSTPETPAVVVRANANIRSGPGTAYPVIGGARAGDRLPVTGRFSDWWQIALAGRAGWIWGALVTANAAAGQAPQETDFPPPPTVEVKATIAVQPAATPTLTAAEASPLPDLVVLGSETQYPVRARVVQGWDYEFVDLSAAYDIVVYRDVFGMLAHQIDDENVRRYQRQSRFARYGPIRITLVDAQPQPNPGCPGWGWAPDRDTFVDPYGMTKDPCRVEHSLFPQGDGAGTTLLIGWGYNAGTTLAIGAAGSHLGDVTTSFLAEALPWPGALGPADRPDFSQPLYRPLGTAYKDDGRWVWSDPFAEVVPAGQ